MPDRIAVINGWFVALEVKASKTAKRAKMQEYVLNTISLAGGYAKFVYPENFEEIKKELECLK